MNFLQTYRRHLIFKLAGIAALILAVLSSAYLFMSVDYARSVRKNTLALNERLTAQDGSTLLHSIHSSHFQDIKKTSGITARGFICTY